MKRHNAFELMIRAQEGVATASEREALEEWLEANAENRKMFSEIEKLRRTMLAQSPRSRPDVDAAWQLVANRIRAEASQRTVSLRPRQTFRSAFVFAGGWRFAVAFAMLLIAAFYGGYRWSLPQNYALAGLTGWDVRNLATETRGEEAAPQNEPARAAAALLSASQKRLGIFPYFDARRVAAAIAHLQNAYTATTDPVNRNKYAYYLAKAHLMQENVALARKWLNTVLASKAVAYQDEARKLIELLE